MKKYPHGLDEDILPEDLETEEDLIARLEPHAAQGYEEKKAQLFQGLGKCRYAVGCLSYALDEPVEKSREAFAEALDDLFNAFDFGVRTQPYEFIRLLSLAVVVGNSEIAQTLANTRRSRYANENVEVDEITYVVAELLSAFVRRDKASTEKILAENRPEQIDASRIFRLDRMVYFPLLPLLDAIYKKDAAKFAAALQTREKEFVAFYKRAPLKNAPDALIDMPGLAITVIARKHGISVPDKSVYRPAELI